MKPRRILPVALLSIATLHGHAHAADTGRDSDLVFSRIDVRVDNDLWGGLRQDNNYTSGIGATWTTPTANLGTHPITHLTTVPVAWLADRLLPVGDQRNTVISAGQAIYTPRDPARVNVISDDRPYAGVLLLSTRYNVRSKDRLDSIKLSAGLVGPWAQGRQAQRVAHNATGGKHFMGWKHQLDNEPLINIGYERGHRWALSAKSTGFGFDAVRRWGGEVGNFYTHADVGGEVRFGWSLPDDFGSQPASGLSGGCPPGDHSDAGWSGHMFLGATGSWAVRDITLDGNSFRSSHSVDKRPYVAEVGYGAVINRGRWRLTIAQSRGTREFEGQKEVPAYGSVTVGYSFDQASCQDIQLALFCALTAKDTGCRRSSSVITPTSCPLQKAGTSRTSFAPLGEEAGSLLKAQ